MESVPLSWSQRGALWLRIGIRILLLLMAYFALKIVGLPLLSLLTPFVAALITAAILHPLVLLLHHTLKLPKKCSALFILLLLFGLIGDDSEDHRLDHLWCKRSRRYCEQSKLFG